MMYILSNDSTLLKLTENLDSIIYFV